MKPGFMQRGALIAMGAITLTTVMSVAAEERMSARDAIETVRADLKADRKVIIAQEMNFNANESEAFWPLYRNYRAEVDRVGDRIAKLVLQYTDLYPDVPEAKAGEMLSQYAKIETELLTVKKTYYRKMAKVIPASKVFRFAQLENRLDLGTRLALANAIPVLTPSNSEKTAQ